MVFHPRISQYSHLLAGFAQDGDYSCENLRPGGPEKPQLDVFSLVQSSDDWRLTLTPTHNRYFMEFNGIFCTEFHEYENLMFVFSREIHYLGNLFGEYVLTSLIKSNLWEIHRTK